jgi:uncharacterized NAD(P)/FAD-binding protein YdhS
MYDNLRPEKKNMTGIDHTLNIAIIGGGFCGTMTAVHLMRDREVPIHIHLINKGYPLARGVAYDPHTASLLLNVPDHRMSAFADLPGHYVQWLKETGKEHTDENKFPDDHHFSTRQQYGSYLSELWEKTVRQIPANKKIRVYHDYADDITEEGGRWTISLREHPALTVDIAILATGNDLPCFPAGLDSSFMNSKYYFGDPWKKGCMENLEELNDILIIGNGLTMADTVIALKERGFKQAVHTVSPNGYRLQPWKESKEPYDGIAISAVLDQAVLHQKISLSELLGIINKHRKIAAQLNESIYPLIDVLRPYTKYLWQSFDTNEKRLFIKRLSSFWEAIRHRLPVKNRELIEELRVKGQLVTYKGHLVSSKELQGCLSVILDCEGLPEHLTVQRVINCSGPETHIGRSSNKLLNNLLKKGLICAGPCDLGIRTDPANGNVIDAGGVQKPGLFVNGNNLKGALWESTAIPELSVRTQELARHILSEFHTAALQFARAAQRLEKQ